MRTVSRGCPLWRPVAFTLLLFLFSSPLLAFDLEGRVRVEPPFPEPELLQIDEKHVKDCGETKVSPKLQVSPEGFLANAVVKIDVIARRPQADEARLPDGQAISESEIASPLQKDGGARNDEAVLDQVNCEFSPHVLLIPKGATVSILNSEAMLHNVRAFNERVEMLFNDAMPKKGQVLKKRFDEPGRIIVRCGVHHWMHAILVVQEHPYYAVTDETGSFKISGIPDGTYTLSVWHEELGEIKSEAGPETGPLVLTFKAAEA